MPSYNLIAASNLVDKGPLSSLTLVMPTVDSDGNPLITGIEVSISFGDAVASLVLSGVFRNSVPTSALAGQVMRFSYNIDTNSWWNA